MYVTTAKTKASSGILQYLPEAVSKAYNALPEQEKKLITEVRLKSGGAVAITKSVPYFLCANGSLVQKSGHAIYISREEFAVIIDKMSQSSIYAAQNELKNGFLTLPGGHRVGICGRTVVEKDEIVSIADMSSLNIRIAREIIGAADAVLAHIITPDLPLNTLIISPPSCGKTTILRDLARQLGGERYCFKIGIADERNEISSMYKGCAQNNVGPLTDVYHNCPKGEGMLMLLRSMSPDIIITDEVSTRKDEEALFSLVNAGVKVICSAHGYDREDLLRRNLLSTLVEKNIFEKVIVLGKSKGPGTIERVY